MDYLSLISKMIKTLSDKGYDQYSKEIEILMKEAMTSTELLMTVTHRFQQIAKSPTGVEKKLIGDELKMLKEYCATIGLFIE
jgi:hypothetical protein